MYWDLFDHIRSNPLIHQSNLHITFEFTILSGFRVNVLNSCELIKSFDSGYRIITHDSPVQFIHNTSTYQLEVSTSMI